MTTAHAPDDEVADILALLADEPTPEEEAPPAAPAEEAQPAPVAGVAAVIPGPSVLAEGLVERVQDDLRDHGIVTGGSAVRVLEAVGLMLTPDAHCRTFARCVIKTIARKTGLNVSIEGQPVGAEEA